MPGGLDSLRSHRGVAASAVLEADGHGKPARELAVQLTLGSACADGTPGHQIGSVPGTEKSSEGGAIFRKGPQNGTKKGAS